MNETQTQVLKVPEMTCMHCKSSVTKAAQEVAGVAKVDVNLDTKAVTVEFDPAKVSMDQIKEAIRKKGYSVA